MTIPPDKMQQARTIAVPASSHLSDSALKSVKTEFGKTSKLNLFKVFKNHQSENKPDVFTTIGNRIVIPMKICVSSKKKSPSSGENAATSTFRMAVPASKVSPTATIYKVPASLSSTVAGKPNIKQDLEEFNKLISPATPSDSLQQPKPLTKVTNIVANNNKSDDDYDLKSLSWLMCENKELFKTIRKCNPDDPGISLSGDDTDPEDDPNKGIFTATSKVDKQNYGNRPITATEYNPMSKPPYSFSCLIFMAVENSKEKMLPVKDIYSWVCRNFPYFRTAPSGWKNSIRHNLSLNRCFKKADVKDPSKDTVKGSLWCIDPAYRPNLVQALKRSPFYPYLHPTGIGQPLSLNNLANLLPGVQTGRVPTWTPKSPYNGNIWADPDVASAALNLIGLRQNDSPKTSDSVRTTLKELQEEIFKDADWSDNKSRERSESFTSGGAEQVVISGACQDHNYSCMSVGDDDVRCASPGSDKSAPDAAYEFETGDWDSSDGELVVDAGSGEESKLFDSGFASLRNCDVNNKKRKKDEDSAQNKKKKKLEQNKKLPASKKSRKLKVQFASNKKKGRVRKNSDGDSGKDSPKVSRVQKRRKITPLKKKKSSLTPPIKSRRRSFDELEQKPKLSFRNMSSPSNYNTRSSGQRSTNQTTGSRRSERMSKKSERDEDEEIKLAAGSLLRLAGLVGSPLPPPRASLS